MGRKRLLPRDRSDRKLRIVTHRHVYEWRRKAHRPMVQGTADGGPPAGTVVLRVLLRRRPMAISEPPSSLLVCQGEAVTVRAHASAVFEFLSGKVSAT
ncbi:hypothetical protein Cni_G12186 [Canna indica]|uniref:Uncharacterized protein n=1 Tax=Canna indica TaxID=4628 RepID=A0AAQ3QBJ9_9LILI|nr:hypothetical protein Cni_G12186 [Canna indica]